MSAVSVQPGAIAGNRPPHPNSSSLGSLPPQRLHSHPNLPGQSLARAVADLRLPEELWDEHW